MKRSLLDRNPLLVAILAIIVFVGVVFLIFALIAFYHINQDLNQPWQARTNNTFTDTTGIVWRILYTDEAGNRLIITEAAQGSEPVLGIPNRVRPFGSYTAVPPMVGSPVQYDTRGLFVPLSQSDALRIALDNWFDYVLAPELRYTAIPTGNIDGEYTYASQGVATAQNALFVLSKYEHMKFKSHGTLNSVPHTWLRCSYYALVSHVTIIGDTTLYPSIGGIASTSELGFRPALWVRPPS